MASSAKRIPYEIRPSKQIERRILMDILQISRESGFRLPEYRYIGFGGIKFVDFLLINRYVGITKMTSIESDEEVIERCKFNKPFSTIDLYEGYFSEFAETLQSDDRSVIWLDYDGALSSDIFDDIILCGARVANESFLIITINAEPSGPLRKSKPKKRRLAFEENFSDFASGFVDNNFLDANFRHTVALILSRMLTYGFSNRSPIQFIPLVQTLYKDTAWMVTIGGIVGDPSAPAIKMLTAAVQSTIPGLYPEDTDAFFQLPQINISEPERKLLDTVATQTEDASLHRRLAARLGFDDEFIDAYRHVIRYVPRYVESTV